MSEIAKDYARCRRLEQERERKHRKYTSKAASDARAVHYQKPQTCGEDDEELDFGFDLSDEGKGAEAVRSFDERKNGSYYTRRIKVARMRLSRKHPELLEVFNLVVKNGKNRRAGGESGACGKRNRSSLLLRRQTKVCRNQVPMTENQAEKAFRQLHV